MVANLTFSDEHYALYLRYQTARHAGGGMDQDSRDQYAQFLLQSRVNTRLVEFREPDGSCAWCPSSTCCPTASPRSTPSSTRTCRAPRFGTYNVLWQIAQARELGLPYVYLGYWIEQSPKMAYKINFRPLEARIDGAGACWSAEEPPASRMP